MRELEKQFEIMETMVRGDADVHQAFIEMNKLLKLMYVYLESKIDALD